MASQQLRRSIRPIEPTALPAGRDATGGAQRASLAEGAKHLSQARGRQPAHSLRAHSAVQT